MKAQLTGLIAAPFTPMHPDGGINLDMIENIAAQLRQDGVSGAFICGTTGEGSSLTISERLEIAEKWVAVCGDDLKVIVHVGHNSIGEAKTLAAHAESINAHSIAALAPSYFKPASVDSLVDVCASIAHSAPALPFFYYHIPSMTGVNVSMPAFLESASLRIPTLAGIKFSTNDLMQFRRCATMDNGKYTMFFGSDEMLLGAIAMGARGAVGSTYNYAAPNYLKMMDAYDAQDMPTAQEYASRAVSLVEVLVKYGVMQTGKEIMAMRGVDCGPVRLPLKQLTNEQKKRLFDDVRALPIFDSVHLVETAK